MGRYWTKTGITWLGVINCDRPRCREQHTWPVENPPPDRSFQWNKTPEQLDEASRQQLIASDELASHPLPAGWVKLKYMLYNEGVEGNPSYYTFHSPHCAALYLDSLPDAKGNQDPRRVRGTQANAT